VTYAVDRLTEFNRKVPAVQWVDLEDYPEYDRQVPIFSKWPEPDTTIPSVTGQLTYQGTAEKQAELDTFHSSKDRYTQKLEIRVGGISSRVNAIWVTVVVLSLLGAAGTTILYQNSATELRAENENLRQQNAELRQDLQKSEETLESAQTRYVSFK